MQSACREWCYSIKFHKSEQSYGNNYFIFGKFQEIICQGVAIPHTVISGGHTPATPFKRTRELSPEF